MTKHKGHLDKRKKVTNPHYQQKHRVVVHTLGLALGSQKEVTEPTVVFLLT